MVSLEELYVAVVGILLLAALGVSIPVLVQIVRDGLERRRDQTSGKRKPGPEDEDGDPSPSAGDRNETAERTYLTCDHCGATNEPEFRYCRRCAEQL